MRECPVFEMIKYVSEMKKMEVYDFKTITIMKLCGLY